MSFRSRVTSTAMCAALALSAEQATASVFTFTDPLNWESAFLGSQVTEDFNGSASSFLANSTGNPIGTITTVDLEGGLGDPGPTGLTGTGFLEGEVDSSSVVTSDGLNLHFNFSVGGITGFALIGLQADDETSPDGLDLAEIGLIVDGESFLVSDILGLTNSSDGLEVSSVDNTDPIPFIGFISTTPISGFTMTHGDNVAPGEVSGDLENFFVNELRVAGGPSQVNEPTTWVLLSLGLFGIGFAQRWKKANASSK